MRIEDFNLFPLFYSVTVFRELGGFNRNFFDTENLALSASTYPETAPWFAN